MLAWSYGAFHVRTAWYAFLLSLLILTLIVSPACPHVCEVHTTSVVCTSLVPRPLGGGMSGQEDGLRERAAGRSAVVRRAYGNGAFVAIMCRPSLSVYIVP